MTTSQQIRAVLNEMIAAEQEAVAAGDAFADPARVDALTDFRVKVNGIMHAADETLDQ